MRCYRSVYIVFFKQKTAYEMRISDWSSDVCSSDLVGTSTVSLRLPTSTLATLASYLGREQPLTAISGRRPSRVFCRSMKPVAMPPARTSSRIRNRPPMNRISASFGLWDFKAHTSERVEARKRSEKECEGKEVVGT